MLVYVHACVHVCALELVQRKRKELLQFPLGSQKTFNLPFMTPN